MKKYLTVFSSFIIMLCIGSVYAWSLIAAELIEKYGFSAFHAQIIFGTLIAIFPVTMILTGHLSKRTQYRYFGYVSGILFLVGYAIAGISGPVSGGLLFDITGTFFHSIILASFMSFAGSLIFLYKAAFKPEKKFRKT